MEADFRANNSHNLFEAVRKFEGRPKKTLSVIKDKTGKKCFQTKEALSCWKEHFQAHLNTAFPFDQQVSTNELEKARGRWGMKINSQKCKVLSPSNNDLTIAGTTVEKTDEFVFLGSVVPGSISDVKLRIALAFSAFGRSEKTYGIVKMYQIPACITH